MVPAIFLTSFPHFISEATFTSPSPLPHPTPPTPNHRRILEPIHSCSCNILALSFTRHIYTFQLPTTNATKMAIVWNCQVVIIGGCWNMLHQRRAPRIWRTSQEQRMNQKSLHNEQEDAFPIALWIILLTKKIQKYFEQTSFQHTGNSSTKRVEYFHKTSKMDVIFSKPLSWTTLGNFAGCMTLTHFSSLCD